MNSSINKRQITLVDPETKEKFKVFINAKDVKKITNDPSYQLKMINDLKKVRDETNPLKVGQTNNFVELKLMDESDKIHCLKVSAAEHDQALKDLSYASNLLNKHLSGSSSSSNVTQQTSSGANKNVFDKYTDKVSNAERDGVYELTLIEPSTMESFTLFVDLETFNRAQNDMLFATELLENHKVTLDTQRLNCLSTHVEKIDNINEQGTDPLQKFIETYESDDIEEDECSSKQTGRYVWTEAETLLLIKLYKDNDAAYSEGKITCKKLWSKIRESMMSKGYNISISQCSSKMDSLKRTYKNVKDHNAQSGNDKKTCNYFEELDELFHKKPWIKPLSVAGSNLPLGNLDINKAGSSSTKRPKSTLEAQKAIYLEESLEIKRLKRLDTENYREQKLTIMKDLIQLFQK